MRAPRPCSLCCLLLATACGSDGDGNSGSGGLAGNCAVEVTVSGAAEVRQPGSVEVACAFLDSLDEGIDIGFYPAAEMTSFSLSIDEVTEGETGTGFPGRVVVEIEGVRYHSATGDCTVDLERHDLESTETTELGETRRYRILGSGSCSMPAISDGGETPAELTIEPFRFVGSDLARLSARPRRTKTLPRPRAVVPLGAASRLRRRPTRRRAC